MAPALRMTRSIKEKLKIFLTFWSLHNFFLLPDDASAFFWYSLFLSLTHQTQLWPFRGYFSLTVELILVMCGQYTSEL